MWKEAAQITIACVLAIQMGLVKAISEKVGYEFQILSCPKCCVWWLSLGWHLIHSRQLIDTVFVSFVSSYAALWLCLLYDAAATLYNYVYDKIDKEKGTEDAGISAEAEPGADEVQ